MMRYLIKSALLIGLCLCSACGGHSKPGNVNEKADIPPVAEAPDPRVIDTSITSAITGITYPLHIYLPKDYSIGNKQYPVIYATDGQWIFSGFSQALDKKQVDAILVAIEQGPDNRRAIDYLLPGARQYYQFLTTELLPLIERDYRVDSSQRTLSGTSYGGILVGVVLLLDDVVKPHFVNYLSFDGSFFEHPSATAKLQEDRYNASQTMRARLILTSATAIGNDIYVTRFQRALEKKNYDGLTIHRKKYAVHHNDVAGPSFTDALDIIFTGQIATVP